MTVYLNRIALPPLPSRSAFPRALSIWRPIFRPGWHLPPHCRTASGVHLDRRLLRHQRRRFVRQQREVCRARRPDAIGGANLSDSGFTAGGQIGYNWQGSGWPGGGVVVGFEADAMYMDTDKSDIVGPGGTNFSSGLNFLGTARGRLGYAFNQFLVYGTGGFAYGNVNSRVVSNAVDGSVNSIGRATASTPATPTAAVSNMRSPPPRS